MLHGDPPRDPQALQHRSGRTGRAGRKGLAVLLARPGERHKVERMLKEIGARVEWGPVPTAEEIRGCDEERLAARLDAMDGETAEEELAAAKRLLEGARSHPRRRSAGPARARTPARPRGAPGDGDRGAPGAGRARPTRRARRASQGLRLVPDRRRPREERRSEAGSSRSSAGAAASRGTRSARSSSRSGRRGSRSRATWRSASARRRGSQTRAPPA